MSAQAIDLWRTIYAVDFTAQGTQNLKTGGDGNKTIDGKTWALENSASATSIDLTNGTGIVIVCNTVNSGYSGASRNLPILSCKVSNGAAGIFGALRIYSIQSHILRVMARVTLTNADADFEGARIGIEDTTAPTNQSFSIFKGRDSGDHVVTVSDISGTSTNVSSSTTSFTDDVLGFAFEAPDLVEGWTGVYDSSAGRLPYAFATFRSTERMNMSLPLLRLPAQPQLFLAAQTGNTAGTLTATYTHLRVDVASKSPPR